jgi:hypothetical protein
VQLKQCSVITYETKHASLGTRGYITFTPISKSPTVNVLAGKRGSDKTVPYRRVLEQLPPINYLTTRKLIGHLHFIHEQHEKNLMPVENLAAIWGPTLMHVEVLTLFG